MIAGGYITIKYVEKQKLEEKIFKALLFSVTKTMRGRSAVVGEMDTPTTISQLTNPRS